MIIISYGITMSGSTLAFEMARTILELNGFSQGRLDDQLLGSPERNINFVGNWSDDRLRALIDATKGTRILIKTHGRPRTLAGEALLGHVDAGELGIHVVFRDPRGIVLSMLDAGRMARRAPTARAFSELRVLDDAIASLGRQLENLREWGSFPSLKLCYEDFADDPTAGPTMIAEDLGLPADAVEVWKCVNHRFTRKNVARPERYKTELSIDEIARVERAFPLFLDVVGGNPPAGWFARPG